MFPPKIWLWVAVVPPGVGAVLVWRRAETLHQAGMEKRTRDEHPMDLSYIFFAFLFIFCFLQAVLCPVRLCLGSGHPVAS